MYEKILLLEKDEHRKCWTAVTALSINVYSKSEMTRQAENINFLDHYFQPNSPCSLFHIQSYFFGRIVSSCLSNHDMID